LYIEVRSHIISAFCSDIEYINDLKCGVRSDVTASILRSKITCSLLLLLLLYNYNNHHYHYFLLLVVDAFDILLSSYENLHVYTHQIYIHINTISSGYYNYIIDASG
jgi:hypothetical protein